MNADKNINYFGFFVPFLRFFLSWCKTEHIFEVLKSHLKRAPSLKGAALVKLSQLKVQANNWPVLRNLSQIGEILNQVEISPDNWMQNILNIYKLYRLDRFDVDVAVSNVMQNV